MMADHQAHGFHGRGAISQPRSSIRWRISLCIFTSLRTLEGTVLYRDWYWSRLR